MTDQTHIARPTPRWECGNEYLPFHRMGDNNIPRWMWEAARRALSAQQEDGKP